MLDVTERIENFVTEKNGGLAFPTNLAINNVGAHWTPSTRSKEIFHTGDVVKLDVGVHIDGYIGDNALTVEIGNDKYKKPKIQLNEHNHNIRRHITTIKKKHKIKTH